MSNIKTIHHINFLVRDLRASVAKYEHSLGLGPFVFEDLAERGVSTARLLLGETWLVLVMPNTTDSVPARHLAEYGEGFFLLSFGVNDLESTLLDLEAGASANARVRKGIGGWKIADLDTLDDLDVRYHLTEISS